MAVDLSGKQYNLVIDLINLSEQLGVDFNATEELKEQYDVGGGTSQVDFTLPEIKHLDSNSVLLWINSWNAVSVTPEFAAFRAEIRKAVK